MKKTSIALAAALAVLLAACGDKESAAPDAPATEAAAPEAAAPAPEAAAPEAAAPAVADNAQGKSVFNKTCAMCHASGAAGAPILGDKADWGPRIAQGADVLYTHAIDGFTGQKGAMPARGGSSTLSDEEVKAAVDYMVAQAQ